MRDPRAPVQLPVRDSRSVRQGSEGLLLSIRRTPVIHVNGVSPEIHAGIMELVANFQIQVMGPQSSYDRLCLNPSQTGGTAQMRVSAGFPLSRSKH